MAKLSEEILAEGRACVVAGDLDGFKSWCETHAYTVSADELDKTFASMFKKDQTDMALKVFDKFFPGLDNAKEVRRRLWAFGCLIFFGLGALGGVIFLVMQVF